MAEPKTVEVNLLGRSYRVACDDDEREALMQAVAYLDAKMNEIRKAGKVMGAERIAVMAALNVAHELLSVRLGAGLRRRAGETPPARTRVADRRGDCKAGEVVLKRNPGFLRCATGPIFSEPIASLGCGPSVTVVIVPRSSLRVPDAPDVTGKRPPCYSQGSGAGPTGIAGNHFPQEPA